MSQDSLMVSAEIYTQFHRYVGRVATRGSRLADFLNNATTEVIEMNDIRVTQPTNPLAQALECEQLHLKKDAILVAVPTGHYEAPARRLYSYVEKNHRFAHVVLPGCRLVGTVHLPDRGDHWHLLCQSSTTPSFIPITDVEVQFAAGDTEKVRIKVAIFRRQHIESLFIGKRPDGLHSLQEISAELRALHPGDLAKELAQIQPLEPAGGI
jgi:hypothetical protein